MRKWIDLVEGKESVIPRRFWLVLEIPTDEISDKSDWHVNRAARQNKILQNLSHGALEGVRGISATKQIMTDWFVNCRNATLVLDPNELMSMNDIERVEYNSADYLCKDNFRVLYRLFQKERDGGLEHQQLMMNVLQYWQQSAVRINYKLGHVIQYYGITQPTYYWEKHHAEYDIKNVKDAAEAIVDMFDKSMKEFDRVELEPGQALRITQAAMAGIARTYSDEEEWIVNSSHLTIPKGSVMLVAVDPMVTRDYSRWKTASEEERDQEWPWAGYKFENFGRLMASIKQYKLNEYYTLRIVDASRFNGAEIKTKRRLRDEK